MNLAHISESEIRDHLSAIQQRELDDPYPDGLLDGAPDSAAVLIPFLKRPDGWHLLFIRRTTQENDRHGGQVAFPGGRADPEDRSAVHTALREAQEEIGVDPHDVRVLGQLNDFLTITNYRVTPVIGVIPWPYQLRLDPKEVSRSFTIPLDWLAEDKNHVVEYRDLPMPQEALGVIYFREYDGETLWGASARITLNLIDALR